MAGSVSVERTALKSGRWPPARTLSFREQGKGRELVPQVEVQIVKAEAGNLVGIDDPVEPPVQALSFALRKEVASANDEQG